MHRMADNPARRRVGRQIHKPEILHRQDTGRFEIQACAFDIYIADAFDIAVGYNVY